MGVTSAVKGAVGEWMGMVIMFLVGKRGAENVARILKRSLKWTPEIGPSVKV